MLTTFTLPKALIIVLWGKMPDRKEQVRRNDPANLACILPRIAMNVEDGVEAGQDIPADAE